MLFSGKKSKAVTSPDSVNTLRAAAEQSIGNLPGLLIEAERVAYSVMHGLHGRRQVGTGENFWQYRRFEQGDDPRSIDWRRSARSTQNQHYIREMEWDAAQTVYIACYSGTSMHYQSDFSPYRKLDAARVLSIAVALLLVDGGERVALLGDDQRPTNTPAGVANMAETMLQDSYGQHPASAEALASLPKNAQLIMIGDFLEPTTLIKERIKLLTQKHSTGSIIQILDDAEYNLPFTGRTIFKDITGEDQYMIQNVDGIRDGYQKRLNNHIETIRNAAKNYAWQHILHITSQPIETPLLTLYQHMSSGGTHA